jgi:hypothetical protein
MSISANSHPHSGALKCPDAQIGQRSALLPHVRQICCVMVHCVN